MWVPFITKRSDKKLYRRKGGGGGGRGGSSGGGKSSSSGSKSGSSGSSGSPNTGSSGGTGGGGAGRSSTPISTGGSSKSATPFARGGGPVSTIPSGSLFAGRSVGGGTRDQVYGSRTYGSGYPGVAGRGVAGLGFPFYFWPLAWGGAAIGAGAYLHNNEYGRFDNSSRPGGVMMTAEFTSSTQNTTYRLLADNATVTDLISDIVSNCTSSNLNNPSSIVATSYNDSLAAPKPEQAVQYYRASSVALTLDGYNNTGALGPEGTPDTPLPTNIDTTLLSCLNETIGTAVPLVDSGGSLMLPAPSSMGLVGLAYFVWAISSWA